ncbi:ATP-binding protein [Flavobacterium eburneipallidum]|uniref:ATP-binding protein n=1 Tax=Flavobacterium eburneipallidum TaxID=3003263 RepID=UPI00248270DF|nr:ATP-binding protein [Flavobacterium eburneipallidum]
MEDIKIDFQKIFDLTPSLYLILSPELNILYTNNAYETASMKKREEMIGRNIFDVFPDNPDDKNANGVAILSNSLHLVLKNKKQHTMAVQRYDVQRPDGVFEKKYWSPLNIPVLNSENEIEYIIHRVEDITEFFLTQIEQQSKEDKTLGLEKKVNEMEIEIIKRSREIQEFNFELENKIKERTETLLKKEVTLAKQNKKLQNQNKELEQFSYVASHDLQEPLRSLVSFTELLETEFAGKLGGNGEFYIDFISTSSKRMQQLVKGLLDYSRIGKEKKTITVNCNQIVNEVLSDMMVLIKESNAEIIIYDLPILIGYETELRQLFQNLISNALKFKKKNIPPKIIFLAKKQENEWLFSVQDNAIGIDKNDIHKLFVIFKRLNNRDEYEGTGIGLAHCKKIVELHGGTIWVDSKLGEGSTFNFTIPILNIYEKETELRTIN